MAFQAATATPSTMTLSTPSAWHSWLAMLKASATQSKIWEYIDPSIALEPILVKPILPRKQGLQGATEQDRADLYADLMAQFNQDIKAYEKKEAALVLTLSYIQSSVSPEYAVYIHEKTTPWEALRALKAAVAPNSSTRILEVDRQYKILCAGPPRGQNLRLWVNKWELLYSEALAVGHADAMSGMMADYFIDSVKQTASSWAEILRVQFQMKRDRNEDLPTFMEVLNNFRQLCAANAVSNASPSSYGATLQGNPPEPPSAPPGPRHPRGNSPSVPSKECICGKMHWYSKCYYINESLRPNNWTPDPKIVKKVDEAMKDPQVKKSIENAKAKMIARRRGILHSYEPGLPQLVLLSSIPPLHLVNSLSLTPTRFKSTRQSHRHHLFQHGTISHSITILVQQTLSPADIEPSDYQRGSSSDRAPRAIQAHEAL